MGHDELRNFTVRFTESSLNRIREVAEGHYGIRINTSEAIRRLAEERLDQIESHTSPEGEEARYSRILHDWRLGSLLALSDLQFVADRAQLAYARCRRDFVSRDLLIANVSAFRAVTGITKKVAETDAYAVGEGYFRAKFGTTGARRRPEPPLVDLVDQWIAQLAEPVSPSDADLAARNLAVMLRDPACPSERELNRVLAPHLQSLLLLAARAHWYGSGRPLIERDQGTGNRVRPVAVQLVRNERIEIATVMQEHLLTHSVTLLAKEDVLTVANFADLIDFVEVTRCALAGQYLRGDTFQWIKDFAPEGYFLSIDRARLRLSAKDLECLGAALEALLNDASIRAASQRLSLAYGRI